MAYVHHNIVAVGVDGSEESQRALLWAAREAATRGAQLQIVCCYQEPTNPQFGGVGAKDLGLFKDEAEQIAAESKAEVDALDVGIDVRTAIDPRDPTTVLVELSKTAARVVVGARGGSGGFADRALGSVSSALTSRAYCAVVVVPFVDLDRLLPVKHIVCGVDGSDDSRNSLELAIREASRWGARLSCISAANFGGTTWLPGAEYHDQILEDMKADLAEMISDSMQGTNVDVRAHTVEGNPAALMTEFSAVVDLIVLGSRGRGGFAGLLLGSTSQVVLEHAQCPTIVVPRRTSQNVENTPVSPWVRETIAEDEQDLPR
ncbi:MAG: universal stress protein [Actinomycetaceae bacterium]|nr:universal stress protein [Actinomycetaceae bacterium]MDY6082722.1 universal stress protein [Actinomycetaceae bacterium]